MIDLETPIPAEQISVPEIRNQWGQIEQHAYGYWNNDAETARQLVRYPDLAAGWTKQNFLTLTLAIRPKFPELADLVAAIHNLGSTV